MVVVPTGEIVPFAPAEANIVKLGAPGFATKTALMVRFVVRFMKLYDVEVATGTPSTSKLRRLWPKFAVIVYV